MIERRTLRSEVSLWALAPAWLALWKAYGSTPFQHPAFLQAWWTAFHPGQLESYAFYEDDRLVALAPLYREASSGRLLLLGIGLGDYCDIISAPQPSVLQAIADWLIAAPAPVSLEDLPPCSVLLTMAQAVRHRPCPLCRPDASVSASMRRHLNLSRNRIARRGVFTVQRHRPPWPSDRIDALAAFHRARQSAKGRMTLFDDPRADRMIRQLAGDPTFPIVLHEAQIGGATAAFVVTLQDRTGVYFWLMASHPAFAFESPAKPLLAEIRADAISSGTPCLFWLRGDEAYKMQWGAATAYSYAIQKPALSDALQERA